MSRSSKGDRSQLSDVSIPHEIRWYLYNELKIWIQEKRKHNWGRNHHKSQKKEFNDCGKHVKHYQLLKLQS